jgi:hypothetical protein
MTPDQQNSLSDAWRGSRRELADHIDWIRIYLKSGRVPDPWRVRRYLEYVRMVSGYEERMTAAGIEFKGTAI